MKQTGLQCNSDVVCSKAVMKMLLSELGVLNPFLITFALQSLFSPQGMSRSAPLASISCHIFTRHTGAQWVGPWFLLPAQVKQHQAGSTAFYVVWGYELRSSCSYSMCSYSVSQTPLPTHFSLSWKVSLCGKLRLGDSPWDAT